MKRSRLAPLDGDTIGVGLGCGCMSLYLLAIIAFWALVGWGIYTLIIFLQTH